MLRLVLFALSFLVSFNVLIAQVPDGITVAGGNGSGSAANQLKSPGAIFVDANDTVYIADSYNHRIQKWAPGATSGTTVAGGNGPGSAANQLSVPEGVFVDKKGTIYITDTNNRRIQKWAAGATRGTTIAQREYDFWFRPSNIFVDKDGSVYIDYSFLNCILKYPANSPNSDGIVVAGVYNQGGNEANQLANPRDVFVDSTGAIYIADGNFRIQKWAAGATSGTTVAGGEAPGVYPSNDEFAAASVFVDNAATMYIVDSFRQRVLKWAAGATSGTVIVGNNGSGEAANQLKTPVDVFVSDKGDVYVSDAGNNRIQKFPFVSIQHYHQLPANPSFASRSLLGETPKQTKFNVCADGSKASIFKMKGGGIDYSNAAFKISKPEYINADMTQMGSFTTIVQSRDSIVARYTHPDIKLGVNPSFDLRADLYMNPVSDLPIPYTYFTITVYPAPVLMVHGLWSDASCFSPTQTFLLTQSYGVYEPRFLKAIDYHSTANSAFSVNVPKIPEQIDQLFSGLKAAGIAAGKVDYIGHSMGGILGRLYLQGTSSRDDVHKLITVNTPHSGSQMANLLRSAQFPTTNANACALINFALGPFTNGGACTGGAVDDLQVNSIPIRALLNGPQRTNNKVPAHAIVTTDNTEFDTFIKRSKAVIFSTITDLYNITPYDLFQDLNDGVVAFASQTGGLSGNYTSVYSNQLHSGSVGNPAVMNRLFDLLSAPTAVSFTTAGFNPPTLEPPVLYAKAASNALSGAIHINTPTKGQYVEHGQVVTVSVSATNVSSLKTIVDYNIDTVYAARANSAPVSYSFVANGRYAGRKPIIVSGKASDGTMLTDTTYFYIKGACQSLRSGSWSDFMTWSCGHEPTSFDTVTINPGHVVTISTPQAEAYRLRYTGGKLQFTTGATKVFVRGKDG